jgi:hypothetical protein
MLESSGFCCLVKPNNFFIYRIATDVNKTAENGSFSFSETAVDGRGRRNI